MNLTICTHGLQSGSVTLALQEHVEKQLETPLRHASDMTSMNILLVGTRKTGGMTVEATVSAHVNGKTIHVTSSARDMYAAITAVLEKFDDVGKEYKDKRRSKN